ncbi:MAG: CHAD domain-containing protein, partial [Thermomicrobiales bacterium]
MSKAWPVLNLDRKGTLAENARQVLAVRVAELASQSAAADDPEAIEPLHDLRISAKRLRYTLELLRDVFGDSGRSWRSEVKELQERLGVLHDSDVRIALIEDELVAMATEPGARAAEERSGLISLLAEERVGRTAAYARFRKFWDRLNELRMIPELEGMAATAA